MEVITTCPAAHPNPIAIAKNKYTSSSGSLIGVLKRTIDNAPTKPNDRAKEVLTTIITRNTTAERIGMIEPICILPVREKDLLI